MNFVNAKQNLLRLVQKELAVKMSISVVLALISCLSAFELNGFINEQHPWQYDFSQGGEDWQGMCQTGHLQSPIDLAADPSKPDQYRVVTATNSTLRPYRVNAYPVARNATMTIPETKWLNLELFDTTITETVGDQELVHTLAGFRFLAPAAHPINGLRYPVAIHFPYVLRQPDERLYQSLYVNINFQEGAHSVFMESFLNNSDTLDMSLLFPPSGIIDDYFYYVGSVYLEFQECFEPRPWLIPNYILEASYEQIQYWQDLYVNDYNFSQGHGNVREVQPLDSHVIYHYVAR